MSAPPDRPYGVPLRRDPRRVAAVAQLAIAACAGGLVASAATAIAVLLEPTTPRWDAHVLASGASSLLLLASGLGTAAWLHRVHRNVRGMMRPVRYRDWWAWGGWIIPVAGWFVPYRMVVDVWEGSGREVALGVPDGVKAWWALWVTWLFIGSVAWRIDEPATGLAVQLLADVLLLVIAPVALWLVRAVTARQVRTVEEVLAPPPAPPGASFVSTS